MTLTCLGCTAGEVVNSGEGTLCNVSADCGSGLVCNGGTCGRCVADAQCPNLYACNISTGACFDACQSNNACKQSAFCGNAAICVSDDTDTIPPTVTMNSPPALVRGGDSVRTTFDARDDKSGVQVATLYLAEDGAAFREILAQVDLSNGIVDWQAPLSSTAAARLRLVVADGAGQTATDESAAFVIDADAPPPPQAFLVGASLTNDPLIEVQTTSCADTSEVLLSLGGADPDADDPRWRPCITGVPVATHVSSNDGAINLWLFARDEAGNVSASSSVLSTTIDTRPPELEFDAALVSSGAWVGGAAARIGWTASEPHVGIADFVLDWSQDDGASWALLATIPIDASALNNDAFEYQWGLPEVDLPGVRLRLRLRDAAGNLGVILSASQVIDVGAPVITSLSHSTLGIDPPDPEFLVDIVADDGNGSGVVEYAASEAEQYAVKPSDWRAIGDGVAVPVRADNLSGTRRLFVWVRDAAGHVSDPATIAFTVAPLPAPYIERFQMTNAPLVGNTPTAAQLVFSEGDTMYISWLATAENGLPAEPFTITYSTDRANWLPLSESSVDFHTPTPSATNASGFEARFVAPTDDTFWLRLAIRDDNGNVSMYTSASANADGWRMLGGTPERGLGGSARQARLTSDVGQAGQSMAYDPVEHRIYYIDRHFGQLTVVDLATGIWSDTGVRGFRKGIVVDAERRVVYLNGFETHTSHRLYRYDIQTGEVTQWTEALDGPLSHLALDADGAVYAFMDVGRVGRFPVLADGSSGDPEPVLGNGAPENAVEPEEGEDALEVALRTGSNVAFAISRAGELYFKNYYSRNLWKVTDAGTVTAVAMDVTGGMAPGLGENEIITGYRFTQIVSVDGQSGAITPLAGINGLKGQQGDGQVATSVALTQEDAVVTTPDGRIFFVDGGDTYWDFAPVRIRTIDDAGLLWTVAGTHLAPEGTQPLTAARLGRLPAFQRNWHDDTAYVLDDYVLRRISFSGDLITISHVLGNGTLAIPSPTDTRLTSPYLDSFGLGSRTADGFLLFPDGELSNLEVTQGGDLVFEPNDVAKPYRWNNPSPGFPEAVSECDGQHISQCNTHTRKGIFDHDAAGNVYAYMGFPGWGVPHRIMRIDTSGTITQLAGSNVKEWTADCLSCAKTARLNCDDFAKAGMHYDPETGNVLFLDINPEQVAVLRAITPEGHLQTLHPLPGLTCGGAFDPTNRYYYFGSHWVVIRLDLDDGSIEHLPRPPQFDTGPCGRGNRRMPAFIAPSNNLVVSNDGALYEYQN